MHGPEHDAVVKPRLLPYKPAGHDVQLPDPVTLYDPTAHCDTVGDVEPSGHAYPAGHTSLQLDDVSPVVLPNRPAAQYPLHAALVMPVVAPYRPAAHGVHVADPATLNCPAAHSTCDGDVEPRGHAYPALHKPLQFDDDWPDELLKRPAAHAPLHEAVVSIVASPYSPMEHAVHAVAPAREYWPAEHATAVALVDPAGHAYPAWHEPEHVDDVRPAVAPNLPASHTPLHNCDVRPVVLPNNPAGQLPLHTELLSADALPYTPTPHGVHVDAPAVLYVPGLHGTAVAFVDPAGHMYPAAQASLQLDDVRPVALPNRPAGHNPLHSGRGDPAVDPYNPTAHGVHALAPPVLY